MKKRVQYNYVIAIMMKLRMISCHEFLYTYKSEFIIKHNFINGYIKFIEKNKIKREPKYNFFDNLLGTHEEK